MAEQSEDVESLDNRLRAGDQDALATLFSKHRDRLWRMTHFRMDRRLLSRVDPDDVLQEAFMAAADRLKSYNVGEDAEYSPFVWLRMILMQTMTDVHRRHLGAQMRSAEKEVNFRQQTCGQATSASLIAQFSGRLTSPSQAAVRAESLVQLEQAVESMEPLDREVLALRHFEELSNSETAEVLGIQQKAASIRYVRAVKRLREVLSQMPGFKEE